MPNTTSSQNLSLVKQKRRNSEKRKEKSRNAARCRRGKETEIFSELSDQLPLPQNTLSQMDKASLMRLAISFIKIRCLIDPRLEIIQSTPSSTFDSYYLKALHGFLLVMSKDGDMIYLSENISDFLGLSQADLMGNSIFDYTHPCDHDDIKELLSLKPKEPDVSSVPFSVFIRMKNTLTSKGRNLTVRSASYKVIHCTGHVLTKTKTKIEKTKEEQQDNNCFLTIGEPIPYPSNFEVPLGKLTFLSRHSLDMKFTYVDEKIVQFLGYTSKELLGKSVYYFYHASDCTFLEKSYKILFAKGQCETSHYRFLAKYGGYVWILTQATVIYEGNTSKPQCVICVNYVLSEREKKNEIVSEEQISATMPAASVTEDRPLLPQASTNKIFAPRTADMNTGFLTFVDDESGLTVSKEDPEDLTHLAPQAGDTCIALDMSGVCTDLFDDVLLDDCSETPLMLSSYDCLSEKNLYSEDRGSMADYLVTNSKSSMLNKDPFLSTRDDPLLSSDSNKYLFEQSTNSKASAFLHKKANKNPLIQDALLERISFNRDELEDDYALRAPYIPMSGVDDYLLLSSPESLILETKQSNNTFSPKNTKNNISVEPVAKTYSSESVKSNLAKLLKGQIRRQSTNMPAKPVTVADKAALVVRKNSTTKNILVQPNLNTHETNSEKVAKSRTILGKGRVNRLKDKVTTETKQKRNQCPVTAIPENNRCNERLEKDGLVDERATGISTIRCLPLQPVTIENKQPFPQPPDPPPKRNGTLIPGTQDSPKKIKIDPKMNCGSQKSVLLNLLVNGEDASHGYYCQVKHAQLNKVASQTQGTSSPTKSDKQLKEFCFQ